MKEGRVFAINAFSTPNCCICACSQSARVTNSAKVSGKPSVSFVRDTRPRLHVLRNEFAHRNAAKRFNVEMSDSRVEHRNSTSDIQLAQQTTNVRPEPAQHVTESDRAMEADDNDWKDSSGKSQQLFLVDGFGLLYRSYYALVNTTMSAKGMFDTRAVYGFTMVLLSLLQKHVKGNPVVVVFEGQKEPGEADFRTEVYPQYKEDRAPTPSGVLAAIPWVKRIVRALGLCSIERHLFEADDVIGTLVHRAKKAGIPSVIVSVDKDFRQLLDAHIVRILRPGRGSGPFEYVTEDTFRAEFSDLHPSRYVDILALIGDKADSIKGVPGIGPRTAPKLIKKYGSLEALLAAAHVLDAQETATPTTTNNKKRKKRGSVLQGAAESSQESQLTLGNDTADTQVLTSRHATNLIRNEQRALLMKSIISIRDTVSLPNYSWQDLRRATVDAGDIQEIATVLEFSSPRMLSRMLRSADDVPRDALRDVGGTTNARDSNCDPSEVSSERRRVFEKELVEISSVAHQNGPKGQVASENQTLDTAKYRILTNHDEIDEALAAITTAIGISTVVATKDCGGSAVLGIALCPAPGSALYIDCGDRSELPERLVSVLTNPVIEKRGWFMKESAKALLSDYHVFMNGTLFDVRIAADLLHPSQRLTDTRLASMYLWDNALEQWLSSGRLRRLSPPSLTHDALALSDLGLQVALRLRERLRADGLDGVAQQVEFPLIPVLAEMELVGVPCKAGELSAFEALVQDRLAKVEKKLRAAIPNEDDPERAFRPTSRDDVAKLLFDKWDLQLPVKPTATGKHPANKKVLSIIANDKSLSPQKREFAALMLEHREVSKILNTYTRSLLDAIQADGRIRTTFVQDASSSGRLSTSHPNLQSIPIRSPLGRKVRSTVMAPNGFSILCADYSQIELRIIAALSGDEALRAAFAEGVDVHSAVAARIFGLKDRNLVTKEQRTKAKEVSYGIPYGISAHGLAQQLSVSPRDAKALIIGFHNQFPLVGEYTRELIDTARRDGYAKTLLGRKLPLPLLLHGGPQERRAAERVAVNMPIQGTQADMIKLAMTRISSRLRDAKAASRMILQVHDELVLEVADDERDAVESLVREEMSNALPLPKVAVVVEAGFGESWLDAASK